MLFADAPDKLELELQTGKLSLGKLNQFSPLHRCIAILPEGDMRIANASALRPPAILGDYFPPKKWQ